MEALTKHLEDEDSAMAAFQKVVPEKLRADRDSFAVVSSSPVHEDAAEEGKRCAAICIYGTRRTLEEAVEYAKCLSEWNPSLSYYTVECSKWGTYPPRLSDVDPEARSSANPEMESILRGWAKMVAQEGEEIEQRLKEADDRKEAPKVELLAE